MKNYILWISAFMILSCAEEKHDFLHGEYTQTVLGLGEFDTILSSDIYNGNIFNDTLFLTYTSYSSQSKNQGCASDTGYYLQDVMAIPLNKRYDKLLNSRKSISTSHYFNGSWVDTCIRENDDTVYKFSVIEDTIEIVHCLDMTQDCPEEETFKEHFVRRRKSEQNKN